MKITVRTSSKRPPITAKDVTVYKLRDGLWFLQVTKSSNYKHGVSLEFGGEDGNEIIFGFPSGVPHRLRRNMSEVVIAPDKKDRKGGLVILPITNKNGWMEGIIMARRLMTMTNAGFDKNRLPIRKGKL